MAKLRGILQGLALVPAAVVLAAAAQAPSASFDEVAPIFAARCVMCHTGPSAPLGLRLDSLQAALAGSKNGPVLKAGDVQGSELLRRIRGQSLPRMPMTGPPYLSDAETALIERWVAHGLAPGAAGAKPAAAAALAPPAAPLRPRPGEAVTYAHVAPIFATRCAKCHTPNGLMGPAPEGYVLNAYAATLASDDRARVVPGSAAASELVRRIRGQARPRMPFDGPPYLSEEEIALITAWVEQGARGSDGQRAAVPAGAAVRLHGTLGADGRLDELVLAPAAAVRRDKNPGAGDYVELRGRVQPDGSVAPQRIRRRAAAGGFSSPGR